jgi:hypothetical protein
MKHSSRNRFSFFSLAAVAIPCATIVIANDELNEVIPKKPDNVIRFAKDEPFDSWMFRGNPASVRKQIEARIGPAINDLCNKYTLGNVHRPKLELAARVDLHRCDVRIEELRRRFEATLKDNNVLGQHDSKSEWVIVRREIEEYRDHEIEKLFGPNSFLAKSATKIAADLQRRSSIYRVIKEIENYMDLESAQKETLITLLSTEPRPNRFNPELDFVDVKFQLSQLPDSTLKPIFTKDQWPLIRHLLEEIEANRNLFTNQRLMARNSEDNVKLPELSRYQQRTRPADATTPENIPDPIALKKDGE